MLKAAICRIRGHEALCEQEATLYTDGRATLDHRHTCLRCGLILVYATEDMPEELLTELQQVVVVDQTVTLMMDPSFSHQNERIH